MCGIAGFYSQEDHLRSLGDCLSKIEHRGPDFSDICDYKFGETWTIGFAHARLSILGLGRAGNQPMTSSDGRFKMVYNGEIYNYKDLKQKLTGHTFVGTEREAL